MDTEVDLYAKVRRAVMVDATSGLHDRGSHDDRQNDQHYIHRRGPALKVIEEHGYIPHVKGRGQEAVELKRDPEKKARRWVVEVAHSWFNRFRKLLVRYEKLDRSFLALNHLAASIMALRKISSGKNYLRIYS